MQRAVQVKIRLQEDPLRLQLREVMNSVTTRGVLKTALNPLGSQQSPCVVLQSWALPLKRFIHHQQASQHYQYLPFYTSFSADHGTPLAFRIFLDAKTQCLLSSKYTDWNLSVHKEVAQKASHVLLSQHCPFSSPSKALLVKRRRSSAQINITGPAPFSPTRF